MKKSKDFLYLMMLLSHKLRVGRVFQPLYQRKVKCLLEGQIHTDSLGMTIKLL